MANPTSYYRTYDYISRYESFPYFYDSKNNKYYYGLTSFLNTDNSSYVLYQVKSGDSYDSIALDLYGSPLFYWIILDYNRILDPFEPLQPGTTLRIPPLNSIEFREG